MSDATTEKTTAKLLTKTITIGSHCKLTLKDAYLLTKSNVIVDLNPYSHAVMERSYQYLQVCVAENMPIYGVNTNFGDQVRYVDDSIKNKDATPSYENIGNRQENLIKSLACSLGKQVPGEVVKVTMMLRAHCLSQGYSGVSPKIVESILAFLNSGIQPIVGCYGSIGASGDLIPLATIAAALIGEDVDVIYQDKVMKAPQAIELAGLVKVTPEIRDGLAMINGTSFMTAIASISLYKLNRLFKQMLSAIAMSLESMLVINSAYHPLVHRLKNHTGENYVNKFLLDFWKGSQLLSDLDDLRTAHKLQNQQNKPLKPVQDYYSLRSVAQGFGPFQENLITATKWVEEEMNSVNDNPIIDTVDNEIYHGANFMGYYVTEACDMLKTDIAQASTWIHALLANMLHPRKNQNLPANLVTNPEKNNGFRSLQLLAAALAVQNRKFAQCNQAYMLPTEGDNQDVNSLGTHAALDFQEAVANLERLTTILLITSAQALEFRGLENASIQSQKIYRLIREFSPTLVDCRPMSDEILSIINFLDEEQF
ncbi:MAG: HAL/PAL/TAL family ammonia-lyase [Gammaproteobacteria bacterium]